MAEVISPNQRQVISERKEDCVDYGPLLANFRVRLCKSADVPILTDYYGQRQCEIVLIDLPPREKDDEQVASAVEGCDRVGSPMNCENAGPDGPLIFDFLSLAKLEERSGADDDRLRGHRVIISETHFDCNPLGTAVAFGLRNRLMRQSSMDKNLIDKPVWIAADAEDKFGTTFLGFYLSNGRIATFHTSVNKGHFGEECQNELNVLRQCFGDAFETRSKAMALYRILGKNVSSASGPGILLANMTLTFKWEAKVEHHLCAPSPSATAIFHFSPGWKDKRVALLESTEQLEYLLLMACVLDSGVTMIWPRGDENTHNQIVEKVRQLIALYRVQNNETERTVHGMRYFLAVWTIQSFVHNPVRRKDCRHVDFTELLWDILKKCTKLETLVAALNIVFDALKQCRINAILHEDNRSTIARLIRDAQCRNLMLPRLEALTSIQILLEIGIERFRRDMVQAYITAGFMTNDTDLDLKPQLSAGPEERARALLPLHLALQTMLEMKRHLDLPAHMLTSMTRMPDLWTNETKYSHGNSMVAATLAHFTRDPQLRFLEGKVDTRKEESGDNEIRVMDVPEVELINEFEYQYYGFSPAGFTDSVYNIAVDSWEEAVKEVVSSDSRLEMIANNKKFLSELTGMIFHRQEVKEAFNTFTVSDYSTSTVGI
ncbi:hypothetical protein ANCDUO_05451 [Ancylostoma duodenale]|uniref:Protein zwilch n=1 Tax=Ancylostoma duodenale TaxID=51022 RepID=A0A0C2DNH1_9BILA|nr:hypothetical protein ANCDUO_05451 [Ancylostoma duodenale]